MEEMWRRLGTSADIAADWATSLAAWGGLESGATIATGEALFPRIELPPAP